MTDLELEAADAAVTVAREKAEAARRAYREANFQAEVLRHDRGLAERDLSAALARWRWIKKLRKRA